jgi:RNA polymerase sigma factor (sigma-70 family)
MLLLLKQLRALLSDPAANEIEIFDQYVRRIASKVCYNHLRQKAPERFRLKNNLRYQLTRRPEFAIWMGEGEILLCGLAAWPRDRRAAPDVDELLDRVKVRPGAPLGDLVMKIFKQIGAPIELDDLVEIVAALQGIKDPRPESLESGDPDLPIRLADEHQRADEWLMSREQVWQVWESLRQYPPQQRLAICLKFTDSSGNTLWNLLWDTGLLTPRGIAEELKIPLDELVSLWRQMPMRNADIAAYLGITPRQVSRWRFEAMERLRAMLTRQEVKNNVRRKG